MENQKLNAAEPVNESITEEPVSLPSVPDEEELPPVRLRVPEYDDEAEDAEEEDREEARPFVSSRAAVAAFQSKHTERIKTEVPELTEEELKEASREKRKKTAGIVIVALFVVALLAGYVQILFRPVKSENQTMRFYYSAADGKITINSADMQEAEEIVIPDTLSGYPVTRIGANSFAGRYELKTVTVPDSVTQIGYNAFRQCEALESISLPDSVEEIDYCAFSECKGLRSITLPNKLTAVRNGTFVDCFSLESVEIPDSVTLMEDSVFSGCKRLQSVVIPPRVTAIEHDTFRGCAALRSVTLPENLEMIYSSAFSGCESLTSVTLPEGTKKIGLFAFNNCTSLESVVIPESTLDIADNAFKNCPKLTVSGKAGSYAEQYAAEQDFPFVAL